MKITCLSVNGLSMGGIWLVMVNQPRGMQPENSNLHFREGSSERPAIWQCLKPTQELSQRSGCRRRFYGIDNQQGKRVHRVTTPHGGKGGCTVVQYVGICATCILLHERQHRQGWRIQRLAGHGLSIRTREPENRDVEANVGEDRVRGHRYHGRQRRQGYFKVGRLPFFFH